MTTDEITTTILKSTFTKPDVHRRLTLLREYLEHVLFKGGTDELVTFLASHSATKDDVNDIPAFGDAFFKSFSKQNLYDTLKKIADRTKAMPLISLYLPFDPNAFELAKLGVWMRANVHPDILMEIHVDPSILGGCAFVWNGYYRDFSLGYYLRKKNKEIRAIFEKYEHDAVG